MSSEDVKAFEAVAGDVLHELGYETSATSLTPADHLRLARYRAVSSAWRTTGYVVQRSPLWRRRHRLPPDAV
jgi:hypothetical protein